MRKAFLPQLIYRAPGSQRKKKLPGGKPVHHSWNDFSVQVRSRPSRMRDLSELDPPSNSSAISSQSASDSQLIFDTTEEAGECDDIDISSLTVTEKYQKDCSNSNMVHIVEENEMLKSKLAQLEKLVTSSSAEQHDSVKVLGHRESFNAHIVKLDENCKHYTGFPSVKRLKTVYEFLNPGNNGENIILYNSQLLQSKDKETRVRKRALSPIEFYLLTLCRLKQNFSLYHP